MDPYFFFFLHAYFITEEYVNDKTINIIGKW